jgi:hypothetical protein
MGGAKGRGRPGPAIRLDGPDRDSGRAISLSPCRCRPGRARATRFAAQAPSLVTKLRDLRSRITKSEAGS